MHNLQDGYFKIVRLKTGENILCSMDRDIKSPASETHLQLNIPVQVVPMKEMRKGNHVVGESFMLRPWMGLSDGEEFTISTDVVVIRVDGLGSHEPLVAVNGLADLAQFTSELELSNAAHVSN